MNILKALKIECQKSIDGYGDIGCFNSQRCTNDAGYIFYGAFTVDIAKRLSSEHFTISREKTIYHLKILERNGKVISRANPGGHTRWWPVGYRPNQ